MVDYLRQIWDVDSLSPHGICLLWRPELVWTHALSDLLIGLAYFSIPVALGVFVMRRRDLAFSWMFWCFVFFILACGTTHFMAIWTLWVPDYGAEAVLKVVTAAASVATAVMLWPLLPRALALPSPEALRAANRELATRVAERDAALDALRRETAERLKAEEMLRQSQKMEAIGQLTGGVAHDFNNLLTAVGANLERIERQAEDGSSIRRSARSATAAVERASKLVRQLLAFARKQPLDPRRTDVNAAVENLSDLLDRTLGAGIRIELAPRSGHLFAQVDTNGLESAILNLAVNARDAMPTGGVLRIETGTLRADGGDADLPAGDYVTIEVSDTGSGMGPEIASHAFEPFFTTKEVGQGSGLGLSQVWGFVKQSSGHVTLRSAPGEGTCVRIILPVAEPDRAPASEPAAEPALGAAPRIALA